MLFHLCGAVIHATARSALTHEVRLLVSACRCVEIDIMEMFNGDGQVFGTYIWKRHGCNRPDSADGKSTTVGPDFDKVWHEYGVEYDGLGRITFAFDGVPFNVVTDAAFFDVPMYMILDTSIGSARAGPPNASTVFPTYHHVDWVRVAKLAP